MLLPPVAPTTQTARLCACFCWTGGGGQEHQICTLSGLILNDPTGAPWWITTKLQQPSRANVRVKFHLGLRPERHLWREEVLHKHRRWRARTWGSLFSTLAAGALKIHPRSGTFASPPRVRRCAIKGGLRAQSARLTRGLLFVCSGVTCFIVAVA